MSGYFHCLQNHLIDFFDNPVLDGAVIFGGDVQFQYKEQEGMYTKFLGNPTVFSVTITFEWHHTDLIQMTHQHLTSSSQNFFCWCSTHLNKSTNITNITRTDIKPAKIQVILFYVIHFTVRYIKLFTITVLTPHQVP